MKAFAAVLAGLISIPASAETLFTQTNLVTDSQTALAAEGFSPAAFVDPSLINPWGISRGPTSPWWVSNQGSATSTLYNAVGQAVPLVVTIPQALSGPGGPTGQVFNTTGSFNLSTGGKSGKSTFLFANLDGSIAGWNASGTPAQLPQAVQVVPSQAGRVYTGIAVGNSGGQDYIYAVDRASGHIDVYNSSFAKVSLGTFTDPNTPADFAPFNVQNINGQLYVTYATTKFGPAGEDEAPLDSGFVSVFTAGGEFVKRFATGGALSSPWGITTAPADLGTFSNAVLIGNFSDEHGNINAYDPATGQFLGTLRDTNGKIISLPDLWGLGAGAGNASSGSAMQVFFAAGIGDEQHGLFGSLTAVPEPGTYALLVVGLGGIALLLGTGRRRM